MNCLLAINYQLTGQPPANDSNSEHPPGVIADKLHIAGDKEPDSSCDNEPDEKRIQNSYTFHLAIPAYNI